jgi:hypothetical protein
MNGLQWQYLYPAAYECLSKRLRPDHQNCPRRSLTGLIFDLVCFKIGQKGCCQQSRHLIPLTSLQEKVGNAARSTLFDAHLVLGESEKVSSMLLPFTADSIVWLAY